MQKTSLKKPKPKFDPSRLKNQIMQWELELKQAHLDKNEAKVKELTRWIRNLKSCITRMSQ